jgi:hypothetical protein
MYLPHLSTRIALARLTIIDIRWRDHDHRILPKSCHLKALWLQHAMHYTCMHCACIHFWRVEGANASRARTLSQKAVKVVARQGRLLATCTLQWLVAAFGKFCSFDRSYQTMVMVLIFFLFYLHWPGGTCSLLCGIHHVQWFRLKVRRQNKEQLLDGTVSVLYMVIRNIRESYVNACSLSPLSN